MSGRYGRISTQSLLQLWDNHISAIWMARILVVKVLMFKLRREETREFAERSRYWSIEVTLEFRDSLTSYRKLFW